MNIIRPIILQRHDKNAGLCSYLWTMFDAIIYNIHQNRCPIVDMQTYLIHQLNTIQSIADKKNIWTEFFSQPFNIDDDCTSSEIDKYVWNNFKYNEIQLKSQILNYIHINENLVQNATDFISNTLAEKTLGILIRGTDYLTIKPKNHPIQPTLQQIFDDVDKIIDLYENIFLCTESATYYSEFVKRYGINVIKTYQTVRFENINCYIASKYQNLTYEQKLIIAKQYFISILILTNLNAVILSKTSATSVYQILRQTVPTFEKIYDLGTY